MLKNYIINVDILREKNNSINVKQYDNGVEVDIVFTKLGDFISLNNYTVEIYYKLPNGNIFSKQCKINNNMVKFIIDTDITKLAGLIKTEIILTTIDEEISINALSIVVEESLRKK